MRVAVLVLLLWLLIGPRVELPGTPIRVEDLVFVGLALACVPLGARLGRPRAATVGIAAVVGTGVISAVVASALGTVDPVTALLFAVRPLEYWIVFPAVGLLLADRTRPWRRLLDRVFAVVTVLQCAFAVLQYVFQLDVGFSHNAYTRAAGLTVGPYELGAIGAALLVYWTGRRQFLLAGTAALALMLSISRISALGALCGLVVVVGSGLWLLVRSQGVRAPLRQALRHPLRKTIPVWRATAWVGLIVLAVLAFGPDLGPQAALPPAAAAPEATPTAAPTAESDSRPEPSASVPATSPTRTPPQVETPSTPDAEITDRIASTSILGSWQVARVSAAALPPLPTTRDYLDVAYSYLNSYIDLENASAQGAEPSNLVRFFRWNLILDNLDTPREWLVGFGPSFVGPSVDGSYLRFVADGGLLGACAWLFLIAAWLRRSPMWMVGVTVAVLVGALFIDILYAQRPMVLFWALLACGAAERVHGQGAERAPVDA